MRRLAVVGLLLLVLVLVPASLLLWQSAQAAYSIQTVQGIVDHVGAAGPYLAVHFADGRVLLVDRVRLYGQSNAQPTPILTEGSFVRCRVQRITLDEVWLVGWETR